MPHDEASETLRNNNLATLCLIRVTHSRVTQGLPEPRAEPTEPTAKVLGTLSAQQRDRVHCAVSSPMERKMASNP